MSTAIGTQAGTANKTRRSHTAVFLRLFIFFALAFSLWAVATPLMGYPDEPAHTIKAAAVVRGEVTVPPGQSFGHGVHVIVPAYIANLPAQTCFAFQRAQPADCAPPIPGNDTYDAIAVTSAGTYNPMYYWIVGLPSLVMTGAPAIYAMRIVSALLSAVFFAAGFTALLRLRRPAWPVIAGAIAVTPMTLFLGSGINPNSIEIGTTVALFCGLLVVLDNSRRLAQVSPAILTVAASIAVLANTRSVSLAWLLCAVVVAFLFYRWRDIASLFRNRLTLVAIGIAAVGIVLGLAWMVLTLSTPASSGVAPEGIANTTHNVATYQAFVTMLDRTFDFITQYIGVMGWLDTPVPQMVLAFWSMLFVLAILLPLITRPRRLAYVFLATLLMLAVVPAVIQAVLVSSVGFIWQGRYTMPLVIITLVSAGMALRCHRFSTSARAQALGRLFMISALVAHVASFAYVLRRYVSGIQDLSTWQTMISHPSWQPPLGWPLLTILYAALLTVAARSLYGYLFPGYKLFVPPLRRAKVAAPDVRPRVNPAADARSGPA